MGLADTVRLWHRGLFGTHDGETIAGAAVVVEDEVNRTFERTICIPYAAQTNAATNVALHTVAYFRSAVDIVSARFIPDAALSSNSSNFATLALWEGAGTAICNTTAGQHVALGRTNTVALVVGTPFTLTLGIAARQRIDAGHILGFRVIKSGSGGQTGPGCLVVTYREA